MTTIPAAQCGTCRHYRGRRVCAAYPDGIPTGIYLGSTDHRQPQPGDAGIRWESDGRPFPAATLRAIKAIEQ